MGGEELEDLVDVGHVEVAAEAEVLGAPVVAAQEGMHILQSALACGGIAQMSHQQFAGHLLCYTGENLRDGVLTLGPLAEHILCARLIGQAYRRDAGALLATIVLLLHHQIELVESVCPRAVLPDVVVEWLQQAYHRYAAFMLQLFHIRCRL